MADDQSSSSSVAEKSEREEKKTGAACLDKAYWSSWNSTYAAIAWGLTVLVYVLVGGAFFLLAERPNEVREIEQAQAARARAQDLLVELVMNLSNGSFGELNATEAEAVVNDLVELADALALLPAETSPIWEYGPSVFFATTVVTTIGKPRLCTRGCSRHRAWLYTIPAPPIVCAASPWIHARKVFILAEIKLLT